MMNESFTETKSVDEIFLYRLKKCDFILASKNEIMNIYLINPLNINQT